MAVRWRSRPGDKRYDSFRACYAAVSARRQRCREARIRNKDIEVVPSKRGDPRGTIRVKTPLGELTPTYWSFGQLCARSGWRACDIRRLHAELIQLNVEYGLNVLRRVESVKMLWDHRYDTLLALTGPDFGRIWDADLLAILEPLLNQPRWQPRHKAPQGEREATGYFTSDQDMFVFVVDHEASFEVKTPHHQRERLRRGLVIANSEVGSSSLILTTFLFRSICSNRLILGVEGLRSLVLRHSKLMPKKFPARVEAWLEALDAAPAVDGALRARIQRSVEQVVGETDEEVSAWLRRRGFSVKRVEKIIAHAKALEGTAQTVWALIQGGTALAAEERHADARYALEAQVSRLAA